RALEEGRRTLFFGEYLPWKRAYFDHGGADNPTDFVLLPVEGRWRIVAIPPEPGSFDTKVALPEAWAGLTDGDLDAVTGQRGARSCQKNRCVAVFETRDGALEVWRRWGRCAFGNGHSEDRASSW